MFTFLLQMPRSFWIIISISVLELTNSCIDPLGCQTNGVDATTDCIDSEARRWYYELKTWRKPARFNGNK